MDPVMLLIGRDAVARQLVGALAGDPVVEPEPTRPPARRTRRWIAVAMRAAADRIAPRESAPAGC